MKPATTNIPDLRKERFYGKYRGQVVQNVDPMNLGRLQALVPDVLGEVPSDWALPSAPYAGPGAGFFAVPPMKANVWIEFEAGDVARPIWTGGWWAPGEVPTDEKGAPAGPTTKILRSDLGLIVSLDDLAQTIAISDPGGLNLVTLTVREGTIQIRGAVRVVLEAPLIQAGQGAAHPAVLGDQLLSYLNQLVTLFNGHVHPGAAGTLPVTAPPVPLLPQATPALVSTKSLVE